MINTVKKVINFAKNGIEVFRDSIDDKFIPLLKKIAKEKLELYKGYVKTIVFSTDSKFY